MKNFYPKYYSKFTCVADRCPDSCCKGWDVVIDSTAEEKYNSVEGNFGDRLRSAIYTDSDGDRVFRLKSDKKCPFWGEDRLCDIYRTLGEQYLCKTCDKFPRLSMEFEGFCEHNLALACPEATRLILAEGNAYSDFSVDEIMRADADMSEEMRLLVSSRQKLRELLHQDKALSARLFDYLSYAEVVQSEVDGQVQADYNENSDFGNSTDSAKTASYDEIFALFSRLEFTDSANQRKFSNLVGFAPDLERDSQKLTRLAEYYLYRYYLNSVESGEPSTAVKFAVCSVMMIASLYQHEGLALEHAAQLYSKEVEQSYENIEVIFDELSFSPVFCIDNLKALTTKKRC